MKKMMMGWFATTDKNPKTVRASLGLWIAALTMLLYLPPEVNAEEKMTDREEVQNYAAAPIVISNPNIGSGLGATGMVFFDTGEPSEGLPRSSAQIVGAYTNTDSYFAGLLANLHLRQDRIRSKLGVFHAGINNEFRDPLGGEASFNTGVLAGFGQISYRVWRDVFAGGQVLITDVTYDPDTPADGDYLNRVGAEDTTAAGIGPVLLYDTRDNIHYPGAGTLAEVKGFYKPDAWGNEADYAVGDAAVNHYIGLTADHVLALRLYGRTGTSDTPYSDKSRLGQGSDLRGFKSGEISGRTLMAGQAEIRWQFAQRWGAVAFGGLSKLWDDDLEALITEDIYYSGGVGIRFMLNTDQKLNFRIDAAAGNGDNKGVYVGIREAF